jgi:hypothetical protein
MLENDGTMRIFPSANHRNLVIHREPFAAEIVHHRSGRAMKPLVEQS